MLAIICSLVELQKKCNNLRRNRRNPSELAESLVELALLYQEKGAYDEAIDICNEGVVYFSYR